MTIAPDIETTADGSATLRHPVYRETYHSTRGAMGESRHVFIENGLKAVPKYNIDILEMGFGTGLNAWLTLDHARRNGLTVNYCAIELYPVDICTAEILGYTDDPLFMALHRARWDETTEIIPGFNLTKIEADLGEAECPGKFDLVYFDAFAPESQPELWTPQVFSWLYGKMNSGGTLVTYSAKGSVKRALREAGFEVQRLGGALGKRHMTRATKI